MQVVWNLDLSTEKEKQQEEGTPQCFGEPRGKSVDVLTVVATHQEPVWSDVSGENDLMTVKI